VRAAAHGDSIVRCRPGEGGRIQGAVSLSSPTAGTVCRLRRRSDSHRAQSFQRQRDRDDVIHRSWPAYGTSEASSRFKARGVDVGCGATGGGRRAAWATGDCATTPGRIEDSRAATPRDLYSRGVLPDDALRQRSLHEDRVPGSGRKSRPRSRFSQGQDCLRGLAFDRPETARGFLGDTILRTQRPSRGRHVTGKCHLDGSGVTSHGFAVAFVLNGRRGRENRVPQFRADY